MGNTIAVTGTAGALGIIVVQTLSMFHVTVTPEYGLAWAALVAPLLHWAAVKMGVLNA